MTSSLDRLSGIMTPPASGASDEAIQNWSSQVGLFHFLDDQFDGSWMTLYASAIRSSSALLLRTVLASADLFDKQTPEDLTRWELLYDHWSCGLVYGGGRPPRVEFSEPMAQIGDVTISPADIVVHGRTFQGRSEDKHYYEIAQFLIHAFDLHWTPERRAWCRFDDSGDVEDVIRWLEDDKGEERPRFVCIEIKREILQEYMSATGRSLVQMFDSHVTPASFGGWNHNAAIVVESDEVHRRYYRLHDEMGDGGWTRGIQIIQPERTSEEYGDFLFQKMHEPKRYESFITTDVKNSRVCEVSCSPDALASYFEPESPLPFQISPVFFKPGVLDKYKSDPDKYSLDHRSITCRNAWYLKTYDVNEEGQVHTYITYLGDLPYSEQVYWKSFNEAPRGSISKRAFTTDIKGEFSVEPDPLDDLQRLVKRLNNKGLAWFKVRDPATIDQLHCPLTESAKVWGDALVNLTKVVVEGIEKKYFEERAKLLGASAQPYGSLRWLKEYLVLKGVETEVVNEIYEPLRSTQELRTKLGAHSGGNEASRIRAGLLREFKTPRNHIEHLSSQLLGSLQALAGILE